MTMVEADTPASIERLDAADIVTRRYHEIHAVCMVAITKDKSARAGLRLVLVCVFAGLLALGYWLSVLS